jgi:hypothetical protein
VVGHPIGGDWTTPIGGWGGFNHPKPGGPTTPEGQMKKKKKKKKKIVWPALVGLGWSKPPLAPNWGGQPHLFLLFYFLFF